MEILTQNPTYIALSYIWNTSFSVSSLCTGSAALVLGFLLCKKYMLRSLSIFLHFFICLSCIVFLDISYSTLFVHIPIISELCFLAMQLTPIALAYVFLPNLIFNYGSFKGLINQKKRLKYLAYIGIILSSIIILTNILVAYAQLSSQITLILKNLVGVSVLASYFMFIVFGFQNRLYFKKETRLNTISNIFLYLSSLFFLPLCSDIFRLYNLYTLDINSLISIKFYLFYYVVVSVYFIKQANDFILKDLPEQSQKKTAALLKKFKISERETDIIKALVSGLSNQDIAQNLFISEHTVRRHIQNIYEKLDVKNRLSMIQKLEITPITY